MENLAWAYDSQGRKAEAVKLLEEVDKRKRIWGEDHQHVLLNMSNLAIKY